MKVPVIIPCIIMNSDDLQVTFFFLAGNDTKYLDLIILLIDNVRVFLFFYFIILTVIIIIVFFWFVSFLTLIWSKIP